MTKHGKIAAPFEGAESDRRVSDRLATASEEVKRLDGQTGQSSQAPTYEVPAETMITITSLYPAKLVLEGPSGRRYEWPAAGAKISVALDDVGFVMAKNQVKSDPCCGNFAARTYFAIE